MSFTNPFDITKAVHYSNEELLKYWVNFPSQGGFDEILKPSSTMPMLVIGGKGSGKTHIMKYFSFELQKLRAVNSNKKLDEALADDKYLGVYMRAGNLNSKKFKGSEHSDKGWQTIFEYYIDLFVSQLTIGIINDIRNSNNNLFKNESQICSDIVGLLDSWIDEVEKPTTFSEVISCFEIFQKKLDYEVNNSAITGKKLENVNILCSGGKLILGIPKILKNRESFLENIQFLYLIDEYENFTKEQQQFVNTLIREVEAPTSFKIGSRLYGIKTFDTFSAGEQIREGSEYDELNLDNIFRERDKDYADFVKQVCTRRLAESGVLNGLDSSVEFNDFFEEFDEEVFIRKVKSQKTNKHREQFVKKLKDAKIQDSEKIIENIRFDENPIIEKAGYMLLYRDWKSGTSLLEVSQHIKKERNLYLTKEFSKNSFENILEYFKSDIIDQLSRRYNFPVSCIGVENLIKMSAGIPRLLLITLKHIVRWAIFYDEAPFSNAKISAKAQSNGIFDAIKWFLTDARMPGKNGVMIQQSIEKLGQYLQMLRYSDLPPECSISTFRVNKTTLNQNEIDTLVYLEQYSYIIKKKERRDKNKNNRDETFQVIGIIAPQWGLSINRRGVVSLNEKSKTMIFSFDTENYPAFLNEMMPKYNAPFKNQTTNTLFDEL